MSGGPRGDLRCYCGGDTTVVDSRGASRRGRVPFIRRRRECLLCGDRFTTYETPIAPDDYAKRLSDIKAEIDALHAAVRR